MKAIESKRPDPIFLADNSALDFLNSITKQAKIEYDWLSTGADLINWLILAKLTSMDEISHFKTNHYLNECNEVARQSRQLREWFRHFIDTYSGRQLQLQNLSEIQILTDILKQDKCYYQIRSSSKEDKQTLKLSLKRRFKKPQDLLLPIAQSIADLICNKDFTLIKTCRCPKCTIWYLDITKNHSRSWCSMASCGNRAKAAQYRLKKKQIKKNC